MVKEEAYSRESCVRCFDTPQNVCKLVQRLISAAEESHHVIGEKTFCKSEDIQFLGEIACIGRETTSFSFHVSLGVICAR